jgi:YHS domain-containing protein
MSTIAREANLTTTGTALDGYSPVSYHENGTPTKGTNEYQYDYEGATYYFTDAWQLETFKNNPDRYVPAFGGWCAWTMATTGNKTTPNYETWKIVNGTTCFYSNQEALNSWNDSNETELVTTANTNWNNYLNG